MSDVDFRLLTTQLTKFSGLVRANRTGCATRLARVAHDRLLDLLDMLVGICRDGERAALHLQRNPDLAMSDDISLAFGDAMADLEALGRGARPVPLLDDIIYNDDASRVVHPLYGVWCKRSVLDEFQLTDADLNGLGAIIDQLAAETGIRVSTYLCDRQEGGADAPVHVLRDGGRYSEAI